jgi:hypothetical protein
MRLVNDAPELVRQIISVNEWTMWRDAVQFTHVAN